MDQNQQNLDSAMRCMDLISCRGRQEVKAMAAAFQLIEATLADLAEKQGEPPHHWGGSPCFSAWSARVASMS